MLLSMTGYGKATLNFNNKKIVAEVKALNSKQMDLSTRISSLYREKELEIRQLLTKEIVRGKVEFSLYIEDSGEQNAAVINQALAQNYLAQIMTTAKNLSLDMPQNALELVLRMPDIYKCDSNQLSDEEWSVVQETIAQALDGFNAFRKQEGAAMQNMFTEKLTTISGLVDEVEGYETERIDKIKGRLEENLKAIEDKVKYDRSRFEQEMIYYLEKLDINEEKVRLRNHLKYFAETMKNEHYAGKKLGFIAQEMGREINTMGSKSNHSEMQILVVKMKDQLEQIKEQVLNVL